MDSLIYLYGLIPTKEMASVPSFPSLKGFGGKEEIFTIPMDTITAIVCTLDSNEHSEESIKENIQNDMDWLQEKAFHHHETVAAFYKYFTIIPLKFCTIYKSEESLRHTVEINKGIVEKSFSTLHGNEEWNLKIYCDDSVLKEYITNEDPVMQAKRNEINELSPGRKFFEMKKLDRLAETQLENEKNRICEEVHTVLTEFSLHAAIKKNWSKDATGRQEIMTWNSVFLLPEEGVERFLEQIQRFEKEMESRGWRLEASGPWPAYHFSSFA
ncbi:GvpL/GvpF family gas vesicle protein [Falsibacillus albus]|uniref:Gas vesicle protein GvpL n=1 Tax=Falsibacillus albus TaxID=2478915 RepID=A0A3L7JXG6_9BACI|nr:GvpL/GvpF family gas vesicle protein [Falsibacillus albus]RLQ95487.1 gas vesicle protein GvpL [Falsibacillus albus]